MELQPLLLSNVITNDVVINVIYNHLWRNKNILNDSQKESIIHDHFRLKKILKRYFDDNSLSKSPSHSDYFLAWLENDLVGVLNDNYPLIFGLSAELKKECPNITMDELLNFDTVDKLPDKIYWLWKLMTQEKKLRMYELTSN